jgi:hypothetical protein
MRSRYPWTGNVAQDLGIERFELSALVLADRPSGHDRHVGASTVAQRNGRRVNHEVLWGRLAGAENASCKSQLRDRCVGCSDDSGAISSKPTRALHPRMQSI